MNNHPAKQGLAMIDQLRQQKITLGIDRYQNIDRLAAIAARWFEIDRLERIANQFRFFIRIRITDEQGPDRNVGVDITHLVAAREIGVDIHFFQRDCMACDTHQQQKATEPLAQPKK
jgi:hypothetical protein